MPSWGSLPKVLRSLEGRVKEGTREMPDASQPSQAEIVDRERADEALRERDQRYRDLAESLPQLVWTCRADGSCNYLSRQWVEYTGVPESEQLGFGWLQQLHPDDRPRTLEAWNDTVGKGAQVFDIEFRIRRADGAYRWFKTRALPVHDAAGRIVEWFGSNTDIEDLKRVEGELRRHRDELEQWVEERTAAIRASYQDEQHLFDGCAAGGVDHIVTPFAPEVLLGKIRVFLEIDHNQRELERDRDHLETLVAERTLELEQELTGRERAESALRESEDKFKYVFDHSFIGKSLTLPSGEISVNKALCQMLGYTLDELQGRTWQDITHPDDIEPTQRAVDLLLSGERESLRFTKRYVRKGGDVVWTEIGTSLRRDKDGTPLYFMSDISDITERMRAEEKLQQALRQLTLHVENTPLAVVAFDNEYRIVAWSDKATMMFGWSADEVLGKHINEWRWVHEEDAEGVASFIAEMFAGHMTSNVHMNRNYRKDGSLITCEWYNSALVDSTSRLASVLSFAHDITERKNAEARMVAQLDELRRWQTLMLGREDRVQELKRTVNELCRRLGEPARYPSQEAGKNGESCTAKEPEPRRNPPRPPDLER